MAQRAGEAVDHREEDDVERLLGVHAVQQIVDVRNAELAREARVDGSALRAFLVQLLARVVAIYDVLGLDTQTREIARKYRRLRVHVEHARHADANLAALLHQCSPLLLRSRDLDLRQRVGDVRRIGNTEHGLRRDLHEIGIGLLDLVEIALDPAHLFDVFDRALFTGSNDQALRTRFQRHLRFHGWLVVRVDHAGLHVDERPQALVLAEVAAGTLVARRLVLNVRTGFESDEGGLAAVVPQAARLQRRADRARFAA